VPEVSIIDPNTNRTVDHDRMLAVIEEWTKDASIRHALLSTGVASVPGLVRLTIAARLALENKRHGLNETQAAAVLLQMLGNKKVRKAIARVVAGQYGLTKWQATRDLLGMLEDVSGRIPAERVH
jgi:hypothetical protein